MPEPRRVGAVRLHSLLALMRVVQGASPRIWFLRGQGHDAELAEAILEGVRFIRPTAPPGAFLKGG